MKRFFTFMIGLIAVLVLATAVWADPASVVVGGDFQLKYGSNDSKLIDETTLGNDPWWEFQVTAYKNFGDNGQAYLKAKADRDDNLDLSGFGYTYKVSDTLSFTWRNDGDGEFLTEGRVITNGCDWHNLSKNSINFFNRVFNKRTEVKMDATFIQGLNLTLAYCPEGLNRLSAPMPEQYLIKGKYTNDLFNIGFGYTNTRDGYIETGAPDRPLYSLYGEIFPDANQKYYWEYIDGGPYLVNVTLMFDPITLKARYGYDMWYQKIGSPDYLPNSLETELNYALSANKTLIAGMAYFMGTDHDGMANALAGITIGPLTTEVYYDFGGVVFPDMHLDGSSSTSLIAKLNLDGTNNLVADFNLDKKIYSISLYIYFW
ncbi:MAG TPA: hypothetical protein VHY08_17170 [Bacillota bacterium]|nr:hypothetical protein [Bacillota bacterium]